MKNDYAENRKLYQFDVHIHYVCLAKYVYNDRDIGFLLLQLGDGEHIPYSLNYIQYNAVCKLLRENKISISNCIFTADCEIKTVKNSGIVIINSNEPGDSWKTQDALRYYTPPKEILGLVSASTEYKDLYFKYSDALQRVGVKGMYKLFYLYTIFDEYSIWNVYQGFKNEVERDKRKHSIYIDYSDFQGTFSRLVNAELRLFDIAKWVLDLNIRIIRSVSNSGKTITDPYNVLEWRIYATLQSIKFYMCFHVYGAQPDPFAFEYSIANIEFSLFTLYSHNDDRIKNMLSLMTDTVLRSRFGIQLV